MQQSVKEKSPSKKETRKEVFVKLSNALSEYKGSLDKKRFEIKLKKASKLFATEIVKSIKRDRRNRRAMKLTEVNKA